MSEQRWEDPHNEGAARAAQMAAMAATLMESLIRLRTTRAADRADADQRLAAAARAERITQHATDRVAWTPALDEGWMRRSSSFDLARAWSAAIPWEATDPDAADAVRRVETVLQLRHPKAMEEYLEARAEGLDPGAAMQRAAPLFSSPVAIEAPPHDPSTQAKDRQAREPRIVAADGFPLPATAALVARPNAHGAVVITTASPRQSRDRVSTRTP